MESTCGFRPPEGDLTKARSGNGQVNAPWAVSIGKNIGKKFEHHCTGSIISNGIVLSAAHCFTSHFFDRDTFEVHAGVENLESTSVVTRKIRKVVLHPEWQSSGEHHLYFDIAVIFLKEFFTFSPRIQAICLPSEDHASLPENMLNFGITTVGWGRDDNDTIGEHLTQIDVVIRSNAECNFKYSQLGRLDQLRLATQLPNNLVSSQYCADNNVNENIVTCHGDSGGPSFVRCLLN